MMKTTPYERARAAARHKAAIKHKLAAILASKAAHEESQEKRLAFGGGSVYGLSDVIKATKKTR
jgi:hypothetical protein